MAFADWVLMGVVVGDVKYRSNSAGGWARLRVATSGPRGKMYCTIWAYGQVAETARDNLANNTPVTLRGYFAADTSANAKPDDLSLVASKIDFVKLSAPTRREREADDDEDSGPISTPPESGPTEAIIATHRQETTYTPGKAAETREKLRQQAQEAREGTGEGTSSDDELCPLRNAPCAKRCEMRSTCNNVSSQLAKK